jgi:cellulose synthase operon protein C
MRLSLPPNSASPTTEEVNHAVSHLRAELDATTDATVRALLHYELAVLFEQLRDDNSAAKELLLAVNTQSNLQEPLEHLIALIERRRSYVNLGKLLDRLGRVAESPLETARAQLARGDFLADHRTNLAQAAEAYEQVTRLMPDHRLAWLSLHYLGARQSDAKLVEAALSARIQHATHKAYRDGLRLQLARFQALRGRHDLARATLEAAASPHSPVLYPALVHLEQLIRIEDHAARAKVLEQRGELLALGIADAAYAEGHGIPGSHRVPSTLLDVSLRTALNLALAGGARSRLTQALNRALDAEADPLLLARLSREAATASSPDAGTLGLNSERDLRLQNIELPAAEELSAAVSVQRALALGPLADDAALPLLAKALADDANSLTARALQLEALWARKAYAELGRVYEEVANHVSSETARSRNLLLSAVCWSFSDEPSEHARAVLGLAAGYATPLVTQLSLTLAAIRGDELWQNDALIHELEAPPGTFQGQVPSQVTALLELTLRAMQRRDLAEARLRVQALSGLDASRPLASLLTAFLPALTQGVSHGDRERVAAIESLAEGAQPETRVALTQWAAHKRVALGDVELARGLLEAVHVEDFSNVPIAVQLAPILVGLEAREAAVSVLAETASAVADDSVRRTLFFYAGLVAWTDKSRQQALLNFEAATEGAASPASHQLLHWALRAASPDDPAARRTLLSSAPSTDEGDDKGVGALERFALEVGFGNQKSAATEALDTADELSLDEVGEAIQLARALWPESKHHAEALRHLQNQGPLAKELVACSAYYASRSAGQDTAATTTTALASAEAWSKQGSLAAALEWLGVALTSGQPAAEADARRAVAAHLTGEQQHLVQASATLLEHYAGLTQPSEREPRAQARFLAEQLVAAEMHGPTHAPAERAAALEDLAAHWDGDHGEQALTMRLLAAYNHLAEEDFDAAYRLFEEATRADSGDLAAWEGVADCARSQARKPELAAASMQVGLLHSDRERAASALREAAGCYLDDLDDAELGWQCLTQAVELDISHARAFERLFRYTRKQNAHARVIELATQRLSVAESAKEITRLHWERARAHRHLGELNEALSDLGNVRMLEPDHVGARALASEIYISIESYGRAALELAELAGLENAPAEQRHLSAMTAIDLFDNRLGDLDGALRAFGLVRNVPGNLQPLIEHLVAACARHHRWEDAVALLEDLQVHSTTPSERAEAARLELAILRDELDQPSRAITSVRTLLTELPGDPEAVDFVLEGAFSEAITLELLSEQLPGILDYTASELDSDAAARLARVAEDLDHLDLRLLSLSTLVLAGSPSSELFAELDQLLARCQHSPQMVIPRDTLERLQAPEDGGPLAEVLRVVSPYLPDLLGPSLRTLGLGRKERKAANDAVLVRSEVNAWAGALGLGDLELYLANRGGYEVVGIADEKQPSLVIASEAGSLDVRDRGQVAAWVFGLSRGTSVCLNRPATDVAALVTAACHVGGAVPDVPPFALTPEFERLLARELPRRARKALEPLAARAVAEGRDPLGFAQAARDTLNRIAAVACGDFSHVILSESERTVSARNLDSHRQSQLTALSRFCLSPAYLEIREQLGLSAR